MTVKGSNMPGVADPGFTPSDLYLPPLPFGTRPVMATWNGTEWIYSPAGVSGETHDIENIISESKTVLEENGLTAEQTKEILSIIERGVAEGKSTETIIHEITSKLETFHLEKVVIEKIVTSIERIVEVNTVNPMRWLAEFVFGGDYKVGDVVKLTEGVADVTGISTNFKAAGPEKVSGVMAQRNIGQLEPAYESFDLYQVNMAAEAHIELTAGAEALHVFFVRAEGKVYGDSIINAHELSEATIPAGKSYIAVAAQPGGKGYAYTLTIAGNTANPLTGYGVYINQENVTDAVNPGEDPAHWVPTSLSGETGEAAAALKLAEEAKTLAENVSRNVVTPQVATPEGAEKPVKVVAWENNVNTGQVISFIAALELSSVNPGGGGYIVKLYRNGVLVEELDMAILLVLTDVANATAFLRHKVEEGGLHKWEITIESTGEANNLSCHPGLVQITGN